MTFLLPAEHAQRMDDALIRRMIATGQRISKNELVAEALEAFLSKDERASANVGRRKKRAAA